MTVPPRRWHTPDCVILCRVATIVVAVAVVDISPVVEIMMIMESIAASFMTMMVILVPSAILIHN